MVAVSLHDCPLRWAGCSGWQQRPLVLGGNCCEYSRADVATCKRRVRGCCRAAGAGVVFWESLRHKTRRRLGELACCVHGELLRMINKSLHWFNCHHKRHLRRQVIRDPVLLWGILFKVVERGGGVRGCVGFQRLTGLAGQ